MTDLKRRLCLSVGARDILDILRRAAYADGNLGIKLRCQSIDYLRRRLFQLGKLGIRLQLADENDITLICADYLILL